jgi:hypothetical protein
MVMKMSLILVKKKKNLASPPFLQNMTNLFFYFCWRQNHDGFHVLFNSNNHQDFVACKFAVLFNSAGARIVKIDTFDL